jgi:hypothetical protein
MKIINRRLLPKQGGRIMGSPPNTECVSRGVQRLMPDWQLGYSAVPINPIMPIFKNKDTMKPTYNLGRESRTPQTEYGIHMCPLFTPFGWKCHHYTQWHMNNEPNDRWFGARLEYRHWIQYDLRFRPTEIIVPELRGYDGVYTPPEGYEVKKYDGRVVFYIRNLYYGTL